MSKRSARSEKSTPSQQHEEGPAGEADEAELPPAPSETGPVENLTVIGIGASAGGLAALEAFFSSTPAWDKAAVAYVIVQHLSPGHKSILSELLMRYTSMPVREAEDGLEVQANCTYIIPPNREMALLKGKLQLFELDASRGLRHPIDFFFRSLAADKRERSIAIVLSGTGSDGALGIRAIKGEGGMVIAQSPTSTEFDGMPHAAIATGLVDYILPPTEMPAQLAAYVNQTATKHLAHTPTAPQPIKETLAKITVLLRSQTGHDFSQYKESTVVRRVERRMALHQIERMSDYLRFIQQNSAETSALFRDLLIGVTSFFRDTDAFAALKIIAIPRLIQNTETNDTIRVWVCGCSTGEEAYSIAILIEECLEQTQQIRKVQIFATDIDRFATDQARTGVFPASIAADVSTERLTRFFKRDANGSYRIQKNIRDQLIFSEQDVLKDPPFSKLDLISCRNLLIYLNADVQKRLMPLFHYALKPGGTLFLGSAESIGEHPLLFDVLDRKAKLYGRKADSNGHAPPRLGGVIPAGFDKRLPAAPVHEPPRRYKPNFRDITERSLLSHYGAAGILVNGRGEILYFHGRTGNYLEPAPGDAASNILAMAREGLRRDLTAALHRVVTKREPVHANGLHVKTNGHHVLVNLSILPAGVPMPELPDLFLVILDERPQYSPAELVAPDIPDSEIAANVRIAILEQNLRAKDDYLQSMVEEMETSNEELKSTNEEMQSVNEEMQSANEELETSREELQSVNEELATVNAELQQKVTDLSRLNNDMNNLLAGTGVGTLFVDHQLRIARFTPSITHIINFIETDVGRPLADIVSNIIGYNHLPADIQAVLNTLIPVEIEVQTKDGSWYILSVRPYRTLENVVEGAVITFVDITKRKFAEQALVEAEQFRHAAQIETVGIAFFEIDGPITSANEAFLHMMGYDREMMEAGRLNWDMLTPAEYLPLHHNGLKDVKESGRMIPHEREYIRKDSSRGTALFASWRLPEGDAVVYVISVSPDMIFRPGTLPQLSNGDST